MDLPQLRIANAGFVTDRLIVGGDLDMRDESLAVRQLVELVDRGMTHIIDVRIEWSDERWVGELAHWIAYKHHGMDDVGQDVPDEWFDEGVAWVQQAITGGGVVLAHCHMGINRGPSLGFAVLLEQGWDPVEALDAIRRSRDIAYIAYAEDALGWHLRRTGADATETDRQFQRVAQWRVDNRLDLESVIRLKRQQGY